MAPLVVKSLAKIFRSNLPIELKSFLWRLANRNFLHHPAQVQAKDSRGNVFVCHTDDFIQRHIAVFGIWEPNISRYLTQKGHVRGIFLDIGANIGYYSLLASHIFDRVIAFEPSPSLFRMMTENIKRNGKANIRAHQVAVLNREGTIEFFRSGRSNSGLSSVWERDGSVFEASVTCGPLQKFISDDEWRSVKFIKIDVEGSEAAVVQSLLNSASLLPKEAEIVIELGGQQTPSARRADQQLIDNVRRFGFEVFNLQGPYSIVEYLAKSECDTPLPVMDAPTELTDCLFKRA